MSGRHSFPRQLLRFGLKNFSPGVIFWYLREEVLENFPVCENKLSEINVTLCVGVGQGTGLQSLAKVTNWAEFFFTFIDFRIAFMN